MKVQKLPNPRNKWNVKTVLYVKDKKLCHVQDVVDLSAKSTAAIQRRCKYKALSIMLAHVAFVHS
ncbi:MAG: hypothetical protein ACW97A_07275 [Candidatus Thorarchaeota archaeon]